MITSKERAQLRAMANPIETIGQVGKDGVTDAVAASMEQALAARQLVKYRVLENSMLTAREAATELAERCRADVVQVIGTRFVLYRADPENPII